MDHFLLADVLFLWTDRLLLLFLVEALRPLSTSELVEVTTEAEPGVVLAGASGESARGPSSASPN